MIEITDAYGLSFAFPAGDQAVGRCLRDYGEFARVGVTLCEQLSRNRGFLDVGANIGAFSLPVSRSARQVVAIEAHPGLADLLRRNAADNGCANVTVFHAAASDRAGEIEFPTLPLDATANFGSVGIGARMAATTRVPCVRLDDVAPPDLAHVKIDVEGHELAVLDGARRLLSRARPTWLVEYSSPALLDLFATSGYRTYWVWDPFVTPKAPKKRWVGKYLGDLYLFAAPVEAGQPDQMLEAKPGQERPTNTAGFAYLKAFGMTEVF